MKWSAYGGVAGLEHKLAAHTKLNQKEKEALGRLRGAAFNVQAETQICGPKNPNLYSIIILDGLVARTDETKEGSRQVEAFYFPGDIPNLHGVVMGKPFGDLRATCPSQFMRVHRDEIRRLMMEFPGIAEAFWREAALQSRISVEWILNIGQRNAKSRVAHLLCEIAFRLGAPVSNCFDFPLQLTQIYLADAAGLSSVHLNRVLQELKKEGLFQLTHGVAIVGNWDKLSEIADFTGDYLGFEVPIRIAKDLEGDAQSSADVSHHDASVP